MKVSKTILDRLYKAAFEARENASAPYSEFKVGAAVLTAGGKIYSGCNAESSSYGLSICAERNALFSAISKGERDFTAILVLADTEKPVSPCGACRQVICDYAPVITVIMSNLKKEFLFEEIDKLLKYPFGLNKS
jgi:cytidine deaminase